MSSTRVGAGAAIAGRLSGALAAGHSGAAGIAAPSSVAAIPSSGLAQIRYASTWPRGWMAAAVPQQIREFNAQVSKAQLTLAFLGELEQLCSMLAQTVKHQQQLPSAAGLQRAQQALQRLQAHWLQRYARTTGSLDECLAWSATALARKVFSLANWSLDTLQPQHANDQELISFSLMGQEGAHGAWQAQASRSSAASRFALASALAPLQIQTHIQDQRLLFSVPEAAWPHVQARLVVKGNGQRFPAGQWVAAPVRTNEHAVAVATWSMVDANTLETVQQQLPEVQARVAQAHALVAQFYAQAQSSLESGSDQALAQMRQFTLAFGASAQAASYDWVAHVVPAVRSISRQRVARLLRRPSIL